MSIIRWPAYVLEDNGGRPPVAFGADYYPEQWPRAVWDEDMALMRQAGVNLVTVGVFAWAQLQPAPGVWDFSWLDEVLDRLAAHRIAVDLATATASPPAWLAELHPEILPYDADGRVFPPGARQHWSSSSPVFRDYALALVDKLAARYAGHPALALWHVSNELGCHNAYDYGPVAERAFRAWLQERYGGLDGLNQAWGTAFWSQRLTSWRQALTPRVPPQRGFQNPAQRLDFARFCADQMRAHLAAEAGVLRRHTPDVPVTTNLMVFSPAWRDLDYPSWAPQLDVVSNDHYTDSADPQRHVGLAMAGDAARGLAGGAPWLLMEHSTSAVNWQPVNRAKPSGEMRRDTLAHLARGADGALFFQWRASLAGAEQYHSAMVPHAGPASRLFADVVALGADLAALAEVVGSRVVTGAALVIDTDSWTVASGASLPSAALDYGAQARAWYDALHAAGIPCDIIGSQADFTAYALLLVPHWAVMDEAAAARLQAYVEAGGCAVVTFFSGIVDRDDHVVPGGYPGWLRGLLGVRVEEFRPLLPGQTVALDWAWAGSLWSELVDLDDAEAVFSYAADTADLDLAGQPAITRARRGAGTAYYVSTALEPAARRELVASLADEAGVARLPLPSGVDAVVRRHAGASQEYVFLANHGTQPVVVPVGGEALLPAHPGRLARFDATVAAASTALPPGAVAVVRRPVAR